MGRATGAVEERMTLEQWAVLGEESPGELVSGRLEEEEVASFVHELVVGWMIEVLRAWLRARGGGFVFGSDAKYAVGEGQGRKADLSVFFVGRKPPSVGASATAPDIMVEVISPTPRDGRRDRIDKLREYAAFGVRYYWLVDPALRTLEILELGADGRYAHALDASAGQIDSVPGCPDLTLDLDSLWSEVERLEASDESD